MEFTSTIEDFNTKLWRHHLMVPEDIARHFIEGNDRSKFHFLKLLTFIMSGKQRLVLSFKHRFAYLLSSWLLSVNREFLIES
jgi:hypothetical protein